MLIPLPSGRRQVEEQLRQSEDRWRALVENIAGHAVCTLDGAGNINGWNAACKDLYGFGADDITGRPLARLYPSDDVAGGKPGLDLQKAASQGRSEQEGWRLRQNGSLFWGRVAIVALRDASGRPDGYCMVTQDLTGTRAGALRIDQCESRLQALMQNAPSPMFIKDMEGRYVHVNDRFARALGLKPHEVLSRTDADVLPPARAAKSAAIDARVVETGLPVEFEETVQHADGLHTLAGRKFPIFDAGGRMAGIGGILRNVTARLRAEQEVRRLNEELVQRNAQISAANRELESFTYTVSHDLRAPLRHINSFARLILEDTGERLGAETARYLNMIARSAVKLGRLIDDLLHFSRMNRLDLRKEFVDLNRIVAEARRNFEDELASRRVEWKLAELPTVHADAALMRVVFTLLISNAVKFTRDRDPAIIEIDSRAGDPDEAVIRVKDNGAGFDPLFKHKLFGIFQRLHHESEFEGVGIGLATVKRIIERHGGRVWAEGAIDAGASVFIALNRSS
jgi:PAS domain S-box-containing protein